MSFHFCADGVAVLGTVWIPAAQSKRRSSADACVDGFSGRQAIGTGNVHMHIRVSRIQKESSVQVFVRDNNVDQALRALKKKMQREGLFREMKLRGHYEKPSERR